MTGQRQSFTKAFQRESEVNAAQTTIDRTEARFGIKPERRLGDGAYGSAELLGWMVDDKRSPRTHTGLSPSQASRAYGRKR